MFFGKQRKTVYSNQRGLNENPPLLLEGQSTEKVYMVNGARPEPLRRGDFCFGNTNNPTPICASDTATPVYASDISLSGTREGLGIETKDQLDSFFKTNKLSPLTKSYNDFLYK